MTDPGPGQRRYSEREIGRILKRATEVQVRRAQLGRRRRLLATLLGDIRAEVEAGMTDSDLEAAEQGPALPRG
jgi:hypothetical protein